MLDHGRMTQVADVTSQECPFRPTTGRAPSAPRMRGGFIDRAMEYQSKVWWEEEVVVVVVVSVPYVESLLIGYTGGSEAGGDEERD